LAAEYINDEDGLAPANFFLLAPLKRSPEYASIRSQVAELKPIDAWSLENLHYFVFAMKPRSDVPVDAEYRVAMLVMNNDEKLVSALVIRTNGSDCEAHVQDLCHPGKSFRMRT
jgi:hypothetical protein